MKKYIAFLFISLLFAFTSCEKDTDPGATAVVDMAGDWLVTYEGSTAEYDYLFDGEGAMPDVNDIENWEWEPIYTDEHSYVYTYNTAANIPTEMFISDGGLYWDYQVKVDVNYDTKTFECPARENLIYEDCDITVIKGKILEGAATTPRGMPADSIIFYIKFSDDSYGFTFQKVSGFRRTGFPEDEE